MRIYSKLSVIVSLLVAFLAMRVTAVANQKPERITLHGKIYGVRPGQIAVVSSENNQPWIVAVPKNPASIVVEGEGGPEMLGPGVFVQFTAEFDKKRRAQGEVTEIMVFTPSEGYEPGVTEQATIADLGVGADAADLNLGGGLAAALGDDDDEDAEEKEGEDKEAADDAGKKEEPAAPKIPTSKYLVTGQLRSFAKGEMSVILGRAGMIKVPVAEDAKVSVNSSNYGIAIQGDDIEVTGTIYKQGQLNGSVISIKLGKREPVETKKPRRIPVRPPRGAKPEAEAEAGAGFGVGDPSNKKEGDEKPAVEADAPGAADDLE